MAQQVRKGNITNTHLNTLGYTEVSGMFFQMTRIELIKTKLKNKWDRLKGDWTIWQKLLQRETRTRWDNTKGVIVMEKRVVKEG
jgi:hypothetical protein